MPRSVDLASPVALLAALAALRGANGYPQNLICSRELEAYGAPIMGLQPFRSARTMSVLRADGTEVKSGDTYVPGELLTATMTGYARLDQTPSKEQASRARARTHTHTHTILPICADAPFRMYRRFSIACS